jgi:hypothetical protein
VHCTRLLSPLSMPQLDLVCLFPQLVWLIIVYTAFYLFLSHTILPKLASIFEIRRVKTLDQATEASFQASSLESLVSAGSSPIHSAAQASLKALDEAHSNGLLWQEEQVYSSSKVLDPAEGLDWNLALEISENNLYRSSTMASFVVPFRGSKGPKQSSYFTKKWIKNLLLPEMTGKGASSKKTLSRKKALPAKK